MGLKNVLILAEASTDFYGVNLPKEALNLDSLFINSQLITLQSCKESL